MTILLKWNIIKISSNHHLSGSGFKKVLNWGLGPHEDQTAEMVLNWSSFYTKGLIFPMFLIYDISQDLKVESATLPLDVESSTWILLNMHLLGNGIIWQLKKLARVRTHKRIYANTWWWGQICPPTPSRIELTEKWLSCTFCWGEQPPQLCSL